eukprot:gi/632985697/ref/XP_007909829.1/ PREDICTED: uncharacterized protein LOC103190751 [Callorhinchus milii]
MSPRVLLLIFPLLATGVCSRRRNPEACVEAPETLSFKVLCKTAHYEIRNYTASVWAKTGLMYYRWPGWKQGYQRLAQYFAGNNAKGVVMNLTSPVLTSVSEDAAWTRDLYFLLPEDFQDSPPTPNDSQVVLVDAPEPYQFVRQFQGSPRKAREQASILGKSLTLNRVDFDPMRYYVASYQWNPQCRYRADLSHVDLDFLEEFFSIDAPRKRGWFGGEERGSRLRSRDSERLDDGQYREERSRRQFGQGWWQQHRRGWGNHGNHDGRHDGEEHGDRGHGRRYDRGQGRYDNQGRGNEDNQGRGYQDNQGRGNQDNQGRGHGFHWRDEDRRRGHNPHGCGSVQCQRNEVWHSSRKAPTCFLQPE